MRFMIVYQPADVRKAECGEPPAPEEMERMGRFIGEKASAGTLIAADGLLPSALGARVRQAGGKVGVTDGPFTEAKELIAGFAIIEAPSKAAAVQEAKDFLAVAGDGVCEVRQMHDDAAFAR